MKPLIKTLPRTFNRYPCPQSDSLLEGSVEVDLGTWMVGKSGEREERRLHLRITCKNLTKLVEAISEADGCSKRFAYDAFEAFFVAGKWSYEKKAIEPPLEAIET